jgi:hypothetical protein
VLLCLLEITQIWFGRDNGRHGSNVKPKQTAANNGDGRDHVDVSYGIHFGESKRRTQFSVFVFSYSGIELLKSLGSVGGGGGEQKHAGMRGSWGYMRKMRGLEMWRRKNRIGCKLE